eukprot:9574913-Lingulodinium_polyedra.AAC.1
MRGGQRGHLGESNPPQVQEVRGRHAPPAGTSSHLPHGHGQHPGVLPIPVRSGRGGGANGGRAGGGGTRCFAESPSPRRGPQGS